MPELPEVETIKNDLRRLVLGSRVEKVRVLDEILVRHPSPSEFAAGLEGQRLVEVDRRAKYLLIRLSSGNFFVLQLMITGQFLLVDPGDPLKKSTRLVLDLDGGRQLRLVDSSHLARVHLVTGEELNSRLRLDTLGPEALSPDLTPERLNEMLKTKRTRLKPLLLDQHFIAGIGNMYADEILYASRLHPMREARTVSPEEARRLYDSMRSILTKAVAMRGTTVRSYRDLLGRKGRYQDELQVVNRAGKPCPDCSGPVVQIELGGRATHFCPSCQRLPEARAA